MTLSGRPASGLVVLAPGLSLAPCPVGLYPTTPSRHFATLGAPPNGDPAGNLWYGTAGVPAPILRPNFNDGFGFPIYGGPGGPDFAGDCVNSAFFFGLIGGGVLDVATVAGGHQYMSWAMYHWDAVTHAGGIEDTALVIPGDAARVIVPNDSAWNCLHIVEFSDGPGPCGSGWGWSGADWASDADLSPGEVPGAVVTGHASADLR